MGTEKMKTTDDVVETYEISEILEALPHRYPMLMVDRIISVRGEDFGIGIKNVTYNEPQFVGHFPAKPLMPGVLLLEGMAQTAGVMCLRAMKRSPRIVYLLTMDKVKFRKPVYPGDVVEYHMTKRRECMKVRSFHGEVRVRDTVVAQAIMSAMFAPESEVTDIV